MRTARRRHAAVTAGLCLLSGAGALAQPVGEDIGSWVLSCPAVPGGCRLRHRDWVLPPGEGRPGVALEVQRRGDALVPVVALRGLSTQAAIGGMLTMKPAASVAFDDAPRVALACAVDADAIICAPEGTAVTTTAARLPTARRAVVQTMLNLPGVATLPAQDRVLELQSTGEALARFRAVGPTGESLPVVPGLDWRGLLDRALRGAGFEKGVEDLLSRWPGWIGGGTYTSPAQRERSAR